MLGWWKFETSERDAADKGRNRNLAASSQILEGLFWYRGEESVRQGNLKCPREVPGMFLFAYYIIFKMNTCKMTITPPLSILFDLYS